MLRIRFWPMTAKPMTAMSAFGSMILFCKKLNRHDTRPDEARQKIFCAETSCGAGQISSGTPFCRINAAFHPTTERRIYAAAKNSVVRPTSRGASHFLCRGAEPFQESRRDSGLKTKVVPNHRDYFGVAFIQDHQPQRGCGLWLLTAEHVRVTTGLGLLESALALPGLAAGS